MGSYYEYCKKYLSSLIPNERTCYGRCTHATQYSFRSDASLIVVARSFCKKGCDFDATSLQDCEEQCHSLCYKGNITEDENHWGNIPLLDRSPADVQSSKNCMDACMAGCEFREKLGEFLPKEGKD
eukprot:GHVU01187288.1.p1 GENE.GHVU01187288.1~~GHVU01187288.1.p1  ORF type:complete len:126 (-),score=11.18 GHVU01187288.1:1596-1973(-)